MILRVVLTIQFFLLWDMSQVVGKMMPNFGGALQCAAEEGNCFRAIAE